MRVWDGNIAELRAEYLFALAHICHVSPDTDLRVIDFALLIHGIDEYMAAQKRQSEG